MDIRVGSRRIVFRTKRRVFKIPRFTRWVSLIRGINENLEERYWFSADGSRRRNPSQTWTIPQLAEIHWADRFGLLVVMERVDVTARPASYQEDLRRLQDWAKGFSFAQDVNESNVGYRGTELVICDYGFFGGTRDCYIGT